MRDIEGWPDTDPYPFRGHDDAWSPSDEEKPDCEFVRLDKEIDDNDEPDYKYRLGLAWDKINSLHKELQQAKDHIKWLNNVGGEKLNMACGIDIFCRDWAKKKGA